MSFQMMVGNRSDIISVDGRCVPWRLGGSINTAYALVGLGTGLDPVSYPVTPGDSIHITYVSGLSSSSNPIGLIYGSGSGNSFGSWDTAGDPSTNGNAAGQAGQFILAPVHSECLICSWADSSGQLIAAPFGIGIDSGNLVVPNTATQLLLGSNDGTNFSDNSGSWTLSIRTSKDYSRYVSGPVVKTDNINTPDLLDFTLINFDGNLVPFERGTHIVVNTNTYGLWFAGFITNDPQLSYLGTNKGVPQWGYVYEASGEEYMLNQKPFGIVAPFTNTTQGAVLKYLINLLTPVGINFDTTGIQDGQSLPRFIVDPNKHFTEIVQGFAKAANFQFRCQNFVATFQQQDTVPAGIAVDGSSDAFTPSQLSMKAAADPIINDSIALGAIEPQNYMEEYFIGDGATAQYNLISSVFGVDSTLLLQDDMTSSTIDTTKWTVYDASNGFLLPFGGTLNVLGGNNTGALDVYLQSLSLIPLEGNLRMTHGEWDFIGGTSGCDGVLGGLWTGQCNSTMSGLIIGIRALASGAATILHPVVNGAVDTTQTVNIDYSKRYVMRTLLSGSELKRNTPGYAYRDAVGGIHQINLTIPSDHFYATTVISEIDPITAVMTNQWTWFSDLGAVTALNAYYVPVASNNLNLTVCSITVSVPMQATLNCMPAGKRTWAQQIIGPNEIDSLDGMAPAATIVDSNNGVTTRSSLLGSASYNPGQATLTYFKETAQLISYLPNPGDIIHLSYRQAGAAIGRAQSKASIAAESAAWGDDGVRSETKSDFSPLLQTSLECEMAATARVNDNCYQHWSGTYSMPSGAWFTSEPLAGTLLNFTNLPAGFPTYLKAESITQVKSTLMSLIPVEQFTHDITFGPTSSVQNVLAAIKVTNDVFTPQDTAEIPLFIDVTALGSTTVPPVPKFLYTGQDSTNWHFTFQNPFPAGVKGFELRYSDSGWGADDGNNLISRAADMTVPSFTPVPLVLNGLLSGWRSPIIPTVSTAGFTIPRTVRGKVAFLRSYDTRNQLLYSEDMTHSAWTKNTGTTVANLRMKNIGNDYALISQLSLAASGGEVYQTTPILAANNSGTFSIDILGSAGKAVTLLVEAEGTGFPSTSVVVTMTGAWQRVSVPSTTFASGQPGFIACLIRNLSTSPLTVFASRASFEESAASETTYCKTVSTAYGATSRFSTGIHIGLPLIPPAPTAIGDFSMVDAPVVSVVLPANLTDVWGCEIRGSDNITVLFHQDLDNATLTLPTVTGDTSMVLSANAPAFTARSYSYWLYTYNLFGEYSAGYNYAGTLPPPSVTNLSILDTEQMAVWTGNNATAYEFFVDSVDSTLTNIVVNIDTINTFYPLATADFFGLRYIAVTPFDALGPGETMGAYFQYLPDAIIGLSALTGLPPRPRAFGV